MSSPVLVAVMGPTASGKTAVAERLADRLEATLVNADAFQVYRGLDIGTAKPVDWKRYELLNVVSPDELFGLGAWLKLVKPILQTAWLDQKNVVLVGGTGLYIRALTEQYQEIYEPATDQIRQEIAEREYKFGIEGMYRELVELRPILAAKTDPRNPARVRRGLEIALQAGTPAEVRIPDFRILKLGLEVPAADLELRLSTRIHTMMHNGWVEEVRNLVQEGYGPNDPGFRALGYADLYKHLSGELKLQEAIQETILATRRYAKRQRTWLRREPRLVSLSAETQEGIFAQVARILDAFN